MRELFKNKPFVIMLIAVVLLGILAIATAGDRSMSWAESAIGTVVQPIQTFASKASDSIVSFFQRVFKTSDADKENEQLKIKLAQLELIEEQYDMEKAENERLRGLLNYAEANTGYNYVTASVIGHSQEIWFSVFTINAGRNSGIKKDMPVVNASGLVGRVTEVGATWSKVTTIIDSSTNVSVMVERTRDSGMVAGMLDVSGDNTLELYFLPSVSDLVPGDVIVTNGMGDIYPKGIMVGTVTDVVRESTDSGRRDALVKPSVDFEHIEEVMVITSVKESGGGQ